jgi:uncharacterized protein
MQFADRVVIRASRERVWDFLLDPLRVARCFPEIDRVERLDVTHVRATVPVRMAFLTMRVVVDVEVAEQDAPARAAFRIHATGPGSSVDATAVFGLVDGPATAAGTPPATTLEWSADVEPHGMAAAIGPGTIEREAEPILRRAIDCLRRSVEEG